MKLNEQTLGAAMPMPPEAYCRAFESALARIERQAAAERLAKPAIRRIGAIALAVVLLLATAIGIAEALNLGVFDFLRSIYGDSRVQPLPEARQLLQKDLYSRTVGGTEVKIGEAMYDGSTLRVVYSVSRPEITTVFTEEDSWNYESEFYQKVWEDGVTLFGGCDFFTVDGVEYTMTNNTAESTLPGKNPGEMLHFLDIQLQGTGIAPTGKFTVGLRAFKGETRAEELLTFTMDATNLTGVRMLKQEGGPAVFGDTTITIREARLTPVHADLLYRVDIDASASVPEADDRMFDWLNAYLVDRDGNMLTGGEGEWMTVESPVRDDIPRHAVYAAQFQPISNPPETVFFAPVTFDRDGNATVDMTRAIALK